MKVQVVPLPVTPVTLIALEPLRINPVVLVMVTALSNTTTRFCFALFSTFALVILGAASSTFIFKA
ncbi:hypothetical protein AGMMS49991_05290 [Spirochaetia bacterium]|nr:hypothetical protein AGMMS49991_05290 [Spirochaetia bacterium]